MELNHTEESGRHEFFVILGQEGVPLFSMRYRDGIGQEVKERLLFRGDTCYIPPGNAHAFLGLVPGVILRGFSNLPYDATHDVSDRLFW